MRPAPDLARELEKISDALDWADKHFMAEALMNSAAHLNTTVRPSPLAVSVAQALEDVKRLASELREES